MLFIILLFLAVSSIILFFLKRDRETFFLLGMCFSFIVMFIGITIYLAKTGGLSPEQKMFLFFDTRIQRWLSYLIFPLRNLGYTIAVGRYLFPFFLLMFAANKSMIPSIQRLKHKFWLFLLLPAVSLLIYYPNFFFELVKGRFELQKLLMRGTFCWIHIYLAVSVFLLCYEYYCITIPHCKRQFRYILVFILSVTVQYAIYCVQDPIQVYQIYSQEYMRFNGRLYTDSTMSVAGWYLFAVITLLFVVLGFWSLRTYTEIDRKENRDEIRIQRKFETASMGVTVFVHSIKNQLLSNRVLCKKIRRELAAEQPDMEKLREYACMLEQFNENMLGRMEELYKSIKSNALILSPIPAGQVVTQAIRQFQQKYRGVSVDVLGDQDEVILADVQHLGEAVYNLLTNAHEAFLVSGKTEKEILQIILHRERFYIGFEIRDNGNGIAEKERQKIFYPFYTSKNTNNNWGMGLYYVREIVKGHFGMMKMESVPGEGTSFCMMIPRYEPRKRLNLKWKRGEV